MSNPEVKFEIDEHGRIGYRVTNEGVLLSKDEKEFIIDHVARMQAENARLREELEFEREDNASIRRLFDAIAPRCGKPDCPSLVEYVEKLRDLVRYMYRCFVRGHDWGPYCAGETVWVEDRMRELGIEVDG